MDKPNNLVWHAHSITGRDRARHNAQRPFVIWLTGLSGSGKSKLAGALEERLFAQGHRCYLLEPGEFLEVHLNAPLAVFEQRDPKGLYKKARSGEIKHLTGIDSPYEIPLEAEVVLDTSARDVPGCVDEVLAFCRKAELIPASGGSRQAG